MKVTAWNLGADKYLDQRTRHVDSWRFVELWMRSTRISSLLEVGGGAGYASSFLPTGAAYLNIDPNLDRSSCHPNTECIDWLDFPKEKHAGKWDGFLSMATMEVCEDPTRFLEGIREIHPRAACVTFHKGLFAIPKNVHHAGDPSNSPYNGHGVYFQHDISRPFIEQWCFNAGIEYAIIRVEEPQPWNRTTHHDALLMYFGEKGEAVPPPAPAVPPPPWPAETKASEGTPAEPTPPPPPGQTKVIRDAPAAPAGDSVMGELAAKTETTLDVRPEGEPQARHIVLAPPGSKMDPKFQAFLSNLDVGSQVVVAVTTDAACRRHISLTVLALPGMWGKNPQKKSGGGESGETRYSLRFTSRP